MKSRICTALLALTLIIAVTNVHAAAMDDNHPKKELVTDMTEEQKAARLTEIKNRVEEIRAMDKSELSRMERKALKKELREMNREVRKSGGGVYLSVGAIIIIILLLILIL